MATVLASSQEKYQQRGHLFLVADGMGAHAAGELASKLAADIVSLTYFKLVDRPPHEAILAAVRDANSQIHTRGNASDDFRGMGTTVSTLLLLPQGALVAHAGDSRVYRHRGNRLEQLTFDHSLVWELRAAGHGASDDYPTYVPKNIITRSLGPNAEVQVDLEGPFPIEPGDTFLLCSDGLSGQVRDEEIGKILNSLPPRDAVRALVDLANLRGGPDNITVIVARVKSPMSNCGNQAVLPLSSTASPAPPPVHPAVWTVMGFFVLGAVILASVGKMVAAAVSLLGAGVAGLVGLIQKLAHQEPRLDQRPLGKGPHTSTECAVDASFVEKLAKIVRQLEEAASGADWSIDWDRFRAHESRASVANHSGNLTEAVCEYCRAMSSLMAELRSQRERKKPANSEPEYLEGHP